jgi:DNA-binding XRE family transcriptional regulator
MPCTFQNFPKSSSVLFVKIKQFERGSDRCRRCHHPLGVNYIELFVPTLPDCPKARSPVATGIELGGLMRRLRSRRGMTQDALASLTGVHRTYLSRAERGQVVPSIISLMRIARALGVDKILLRVRSSSHLR